MAEQILSTDQFISTYAAPDPCLSVAPSLRAEDAGKPALSPISSKPDVDRSSRALCQSMKMVLLALIDRIDALENEVLDRNVASLDLRDEVNQFEGALIRAALASTKGRQRRAARVLGMKVSTLNAKIRRYQVTDD